MYMTVLIKMMPKAFILPSLSISQRIITSHNTHTSRPTFAENHPTLHATAKNHLTNMEYIFDIARQESNI